MRANSGEQGLTKKYAIRRCVGRRPSDTTYALIS
nr:MAG TPA: hypothetical protein [Caudoviricetes sp.]